MWWWFVAMGWAAEPGGGDVVPMCGTELVAASASAPPQRTLSAEDDLAGALFVNGLRRQVSNRWKAHLHALSPSLRLREPRYTTVVTITIDAEGNLTTLCLAAASGIPALDRAVSDAFWEATPFSPPPPHFLRDGAWGLSDLDFTVTLPHTPGARAR